MKDLFNNELSIGQEVAFNAPIYKGLSKGIIRGFTSKMVKIEYFSASGWNKNYDGSPNITHVYPNDCSLKYENFEEKIKHGISD